MEIIITALGCLMIFYIQLNIYREHCFKSLDYKCYFNKSEAVEGDEIEFTEEILNRKHLPLPVFKSELTVSSALEFADTHSSVTDKSRFVTSVFNIKGSSSVKRIWKVKCTKRGIFSVNNIVLVTSDIFGSEFYSLKPEFELPKITVFPSAIPFDVFRIMSRQRTGEIQFGNTPFTDPFFPSGIREYTGAEPLKFINHNASAKKCRLMVNNYESSSDSAAKVFLDLNCCTVTAEHNIRICRFLIEQLNKFGIKTELLIASNPPFHIFQHKRKNNLNLLLYALAEVDVDKSAPISDIPVIPDDNSILITADINTVTSDYMTVIYTGKAKNIKHANVIYADERRRKL